MAGTAAPPGSRKSPGELARPRVRGSACGYCRGVPPRPARKAPAATAGRTDGGGPAGGDAKSHVGLPPAPESRATTATEDTARGASGSRCVTGQPGARARTSPLVGTGPRGGGQVDNGAPGCACAVRSEGRRGGPGARGCFGDPPSVRVHPRASWRRARGAGGPRGGGDPQGPEVVLCRGGCPVSLGTVCPRTS